MSFNKIIIVGNLGQDPELRYTPNGNAVCNFSLATNEKKRDKAGEYQDVTTWFRVTLWEKRAEVASKYLTKGRPVYIEGRLRIDEWTDKDGNNRYTLDVTATDMQFIGGGREEDGGFYNDSDNTQTRAGNEFSNPKSAAEETGGDEETGGGGEVLNDDDIPF